MPSRRAVIGSLALGSLCVGAGAWRFWPSAASPVDADAVMRLLVDTPTEQVATCVAGLIAEGLPIQTVLDAAFHAPIVYQCDASDVHASLVAVPILDLAGDDPNWRALACWSAEFTAQWLLSPTLEPRRDPPTTLSIEAAIDARDGPAASAAVFQGGVDVARAAIIRRAAISLRDPHQAIYVAQSLRALGRFGDRYALPVFASVARRLTLHPQSDQETFQRVEGLAARLPQTGSANPEIALWLSARLAEADALDAVDDLLEHGLNPATIEMAARRTAVALAGHASGLSGEGVHAFNLLDALLAIARRAPDHQSRAVALIAALQGLGMRRVRVELPSAPEGPMSLVVSIAQRQAGAHPVDAHAFKFAHALGRIMAHAPANERSTLARWVGGAPLFSAEGDWTRRAAVEARLRS